MNCKICNRKFKNFRSLLAHVRQKHNISSKDYYDKYLKQDGEGICECGKETKYMSPTIGYRKYCSIKCSTNSKKWIENRKQTYLERYGVEYISQSKEVKEIINKSRIKNNTLTQINNKPLFKYFASKIGWIEEVRREPTDKRILNVKCKKCEDWFIPDIISLINRIQVLKGNYKGEQNFYCSPECKNSCSIYNRSLYQADHPKFDMEIRDPYWSQLIKERDNYTCQRCGKPGNIAHHELPVKTHPFYANDIDNGICVCDKCDKEYFHQIDGCKTGQLARMVC